MTDFLVGAAVFGLGVMVGVSIVTNVINGKSKKEGTNG